MKIRILYIDDDERELRKYKTKFEENDISRNRFKIVTQNTPKSSDDYETIDKGRPQLLLVDFDLTKPNADGNVIGISGITLSTELRQKFPEIPIILFTRKSVFNIQNYSHIRQTLSSMDEIIYKNELFKLTSTQLDFLYELAVGFNNLREIKTKKWADLMKILKAPESDYEDLKRSNPTIVLGNKTPWSVSETANWIRKVLLSYPGILYDATHSATFLGISKKAFLKEDIQNVFKNTKYNGPFLPPEGRWWKSKLLDIAISKMNKKERDLPIREGFPLAWKRTKNIQIEKLKCIFSGEFPAEWVCYILNQPVMIKYSLSYNPDSRPSVMDEARVSFEAIRTSNEVNDELFDPLGKEMLSEIRKMQKKEKLGC